MHSNQYIFIEHLTTLCDKYYQHDHADPVTHVTPIEHLFHLLMDVTESISSRTGTSMKFFCDSAFGK